MNETDKILNDIRTYLRISAAIASRTAAVKILDTYEKALVYSRLDGETSRAKIEELTGVPDQTVSHWLEAFVQGGLASPPNEFSRSHRALFTLQELGIESSALKKRAKGASKTSAESMPKPQQDKPSELQQGTIQKFLGENQSGTTEQ